MCATSSDDDYHAVVGKFRAVRWIIGADNIEARLPLAEFMRTGLVKYVHHTVACILLAAQPLLAPATIKVGNVRLDSC